MGFLSCLIQHYGGKQVRARPGGAVRAVCANPSSPQAQSVENRATGDYIRFRCPGPIAQRLEQGTHNPLVPGSNPGGPMIPKPLPTRGLGIFVVSMLIRPKPAPITSDKHRWKRRTSFQPLIHLKTAWLLGLPKGPGWSGPDKQRWTRAPAQVPLERDAAFVYPALLPQAVVRDPPSWYSSSSSRRCPAGPRHWSTNARCAGVR
jgi:hypothetical protein